MGEIWLPIDDTNQFLIENSMKLYGKNSNTQFVEFRNNPISSLIEFNLDSCDETSTPLHINLFPANSTHRLTHKIRQFESDMMVFDEGLITTHNTDSVHKFIKREYGKLNIELSTVPICDLVYGVDSKECVKDYMWRSEPKIDISPLIRIFIPVKLGDSTIKKIIDSLAEDLYWSGYNYSNRRKVKVSPKYKYKFDVYVVQFEAKFSDFEFNMADELYHITFGERNIRKILRNGLIPRSESPFLEYPDRVYLFNFHDNRPIDNRMKTMKSYARQRMKRGGQKSDCIYIIRFKKEKLLDWSEKSHGLVNHKEIEFHIDACYDGYVGKTGDSPAIFTYDNIPKDLIEPLGWKIEIKFIDDAIEFGNPTEVNYSQISQ